MTEKIRKEIAALQKMNVPQLRQRHLELFGEPNRSGNRQYLFRRIAWRMQANLEGDLAERARRRAEKLANDTDLRLRRPPVKPAPEPESTTVSTRVGFGDPAGALMATSDVSRVDVSGTRFKRRVIRWPERSWSNHGLDSLLGTDGDSGVLPRLFTAKRDTCPRHAAARSGRQTAVAMSGPEPRAGGGSRRGRGTTRSPCLHMEGSNNLRWIQSDSSSVPRRCQTAIPSRRHRATRVWGESLPLCAISPTAASTPQPVRRQ